MQWPNGAALALAAPLLLTLVAGCAPSTIVGPLSHQEEEQETFMERARRFGMSTEDVQRVFPPLTPEEKNRQRDQDSSCRSSYLWKNGLTYTGSAMIAAAAAVTIGGAYATGNSDETKAIFGVTGGTAALFGTMLVAIGSIIQNAYTDRGCVTRLDTK